MWAFIFLSLTHAGPPAKDYTRCSELITLKNRAAKVKLTRWIQPNGFKVDRDLPELEAFIKTKSLEDHHPAHVLAVLANLYKQSEKDFFRLANEYPKLWELRNLETQDLRKLPPELLKMSLNRVVFRLKETKRQYPELTGSEWDQWKRFIIFRPLLRKLEAWDQEEWIVFIAESLANKARKHYFFGEIFMSKLYYLTESIAGRLFYEDIDSLTDFTITRQEKSSRPVIVGTYPINGETEPGRFGFYLKSLPPVVSQTETTTEWTHNGETFSAKWSVTPSEIPIKKFHKQPLTPDYKAAWADREFNGMLVAGTNLGDDAPSTMREYVKYFKAQGFEFHHPIENSYFTSFLKEKIMSGKIDYFLKEAHSDGDERNFIRVSKKAKIKVGEKKLPNGRSKKIYIVVPDREAGSDDQTSRLISNFEFGHWINVRSKIAKRDGVKRPLIVFNTGCWSATQAVELIMATKDPTLQVFGSETPMMTFTNDPTQAEYQFLHQIITKEEAFDAVRKAMSREKNYRLHITDVMLFPGQIEYQEQIADELKSAVTIRIQVFGPDGKPYFFDQEH